MFKKSIWSFIGTIGVQIVVIISNLILARLLYPDIFGVLGMATVFTGLIAVIQDAGFSTYLIYNQTDNKEIIITGFVLNITLSAVLATVTFFSSGAIAAFYHSPDVGTIVKYIAFGLLFGSFGITGRALFMKEGKFKTLTCIDLATEVMTTAMAVLLVLSGYDLLAISSKVLFRPTISSFLILILKMRSIRGTPSMGRAREIFSYSIKILGSQVFVYISNNLELLLLGKFFGNRFLGLYTMAAQWSMLARFYITGAIAKVLFPEISKYQDDREKVSSIYLKTTLKVAFLTIPICLGLLFVSTEFIKIFYGNSWVEAASIMKILLLIGAITSVGTVSGALFQGLGKPVIDMRLNLFNLAASGLVITTFYRFGVYAVLTAMLCKVITFEIVKAYYVSKLLGVSMLKYFKGFGPNVASAGIMLGVLYVLKLLILHKWNMYTQFAGSIVLGMILYSAASYAINYEQFHWVYDKTRGIFAKALFKRQSNGRIEVSS